MAELENYIRWAKHPGVAKLSSRKLQTTGMPTILAYNHTAATENGATFNFLL